MKMGFAKGDITPPLGTELGGYAGYRPCSGVHDPLYCKAVVLEQDGICYALLALDFLSVDEPLYLHMAKKLEPLGISADRLLVSAIHSHASPCGVIRGEGLLAKVNQFGESDPEGYDAYIRQVIQTAFNACSEAIKTLEPFRIRWSQGPLPVLGSERHTGAPAQGALTAIQFLTETGKKLIVYHFPCHPTVMRPDNLKASADFIGGIEGLLDADMALFLNGAAGDISTRFTRRESSFQECGRLAQLAADHITMLLEKAEYEQPGKLTGLHTRIPVTSRPVQTKELAQKLLDESIAKWKHAERSGADKDTLRVLQSCVEGAGVNLEFADTMKGIDGFHLPATVFAFSGLKFASIPGELYSTLRPKEALAICYANGYYRYIADSRAYEENQYEAMAAIVAKGEGERLMEKIATLLEGIS